jgi:RND family efflux transporter MFP subunit
MKRLIFLLVLLSAAGWLGRQVVLRLEEETVAAEGRRGERIQRAAPVEVSAVEHGLIERIRSFTGTLVANAEFVVAPKVDGRLEEISVNLSDSVSRGQVVARLDNAEYQQALTQAEADLAVARANLAEARSLLEIADRELNRIETLSRRGVSSESERDAAQAEQLARAARLEVSRAQQTRAEAAVETARIRLGYSNVTANWSGGSDRRIVAERYVDEGQTVSANDALLRIVELDPVLAVFFVTERDYGLLSVGQPVTLETDAYPGAEFSGTIARIAPVFRENSRQARVELRVANAERRLKPGMFVRARVRLEQVDHATMVSERALVVRDGESGVFLVAEDRASVRWRPVETGIRQGDRVQLLDDTLDGEVVVLGQQLLDDGSAIVIAGPEG